MFNCCFCEDKRFELNRLVGLSAEESIIYEDENIYITPDIAPIKLGHLLIITKRHWNSYGNVSKEIIDSLEIAKKYLKDIIFSDQDILFFEHGSVIEGSGGACIDHAHMHVIPFNNHFIDIDEAIKSIGFVLSDKEEANYDVLKKYAEIKQPYIYYESNIHQEWIYKVEKLPSQFFRFILAYHLSNDYNWKLTYKTEKSKNLFNQTLKYVNHTNI